MNAELEQKAREAAWKLINDHRELFDSISKEFAVDIIAVALLEAYKEGRKEMKEAAAMTAYDELVGLPDCQRRVARAIRELKEE